MQHSEDQNVATNLEVENALGRTDDNDEPPSDFEIEHERHAAKMKAVLETLELNRTGVPGPSSSKPKLPVKPRPRKVKGKGKARAIPVDEERESFNLDVSSSDEDVPLVSK